MLNTPCFALCADESDTGQLRLSDSGEPKTKNVVGNGLHTEKRILTKKTEKLSADLGNAKEVHTFVSDSTVNADGNFENTNIKNVNNPSSSNKPLFDTVSVEDIGSHEIPTFNEFHAMVSEDAQKHKELDAGSDLNSKDNLNKIKFSNLDGSKVDINSNKEALSTMVDSGQQENEDNVESARKKLASTTLDMHDGHTTTNASDNKDNNKDNAGGGDAGGVQSVIGNASQDDVSELDLKDGMRPNVGNDNSGDVRDTLSTTASSTITTTSPLSTTTITAATTSIPIVPTIETANSDTNVQSNVGVSQKPSDLQLTKTILRRNVAAIACGAKMLSSSKQTNNAESVLNENSDEYMKVPCSDDKWLIFEVCQPVQLSTIEIANYELFSSRLKLFNVFVSDRYPAKVWDYIGTFTARDVKGLQSFNVQSDKMIKYVKFEFVEHYGSEHFCTLTMIRLFGFNSDDLDDDDDDDDDHESSGNVVKHRHMGGDIQDGSVAIDLNNGDGQMVDQKSSGGGSRETNTTDDFINDLATDDGFVNPSKTSIRVDENVETDSALCDAESSRCDHGAVKSARMSEPSPSEARSNKESSANSLGSGTGSIKSTLSTEDVLPTPSDAQNDFNDDYSVSRQPILSRNHVGDRIYEHGGGDYFDDSRIHTVQKRPVNAEIKQESSFIYKMFDFFVRLPAFLVINLSLIHPHPDNQLLVDYVFHSQDAFEPSVDVKRSLNHLKRCLSDLLHVKLSARQLLAYEMQTNVNCSHARHELNMSFVDMKRPEFSLIHLVVTYRNSMRQMQRCSRWDWNQHGAAMATDHCPILSQVLLQLEKRCPLSAANSTNVSSVKSDGKNSYATSDKKSQILSTAKHKAHRRHHHHHPHESTGEDHFKPLVVPAPLGGSYKSNAFMRLNNRVRMIEQNVSVSMRYLEELSQIYRRQMERLSRSFNLTYVWLKATADDAEERDREQQLRIAKLESEFASLVVNLKTHSVLDNKPSAHPAQPHPKLALFPNPTSPPLPELDNSLEWSTSPVFGANTNQMLRFASGLDEPDDDDDYSVDDEQQHHQAPTGDDDTGGSDDDDFEILWASFVKRLSVFIFSFDESTDWLLDWISRSWLSRIYRFGLNIFRFYLTYSKSCNIVCLTLLHLILAVGSQLLIYWTWFRPAYSKYYLTATPPSPTSPSACHGRYIQDSMMPTSAAYVSCANLVAFNNAATTATNTNHHHHFADSMMSPIIIRNGDTDVLHYALPCFSSRTLSVKPSDSHEYCLKAAGNNDLTRLPFVFNYAKPCMCDNISKPSTVFFNSPYDDHQVVLPRHPCDDPVTPKSDPDQDTFCSNTNCLNSVLHTSEDYFVSSMTSSCSSRSTKTNSSPDHPLTDLHYELPRLTKRQRKRKRLRVSKMIGAGPL